MRFDGQDDSRLDRARVRARAHTRRASKSACYAKNIMDLCQRSNEDLLSEARQLIGTERELTATLVAYLAEIEERRLHLLAGYGSMFDFCTRGLGLSENEAFRRIAAARLGRRFPVVHSLLASGTVHLSTLELLREHLTHDNYQELLEVVSGKTKREVEALLATRFPRPDVPSKIRPLSEERFKVEFTASAELCDKLELCRDLMSHANPSRDLGVVGIFEPGASGTRSNSRRDEISVRARVAVRPFNRPSWSRDGGDQTLGSGPFARRDGRLRHDGVRRPVGPLGR